MKCPDCKKKIPKQARYCPYCGSDLQKDQKQPAEGKWNFLSVSCFIVIFVIICSISFIFFKIISGNNHSDDNLLTASLSTDDSSDTLSSEQNDSGNQEDDIGAVYCKDIDPAHIAEEGFISYIDNEILLVGKDGTSYDEIDQLVKSKNGEIVGWIEQTGDYQIQFDSDYSLDNLQELADLFNEQPEIQSTSINYVTESADDSKTTERWF